MDPFQRRAQQDRQRVVDALRPYPCSFSLDLCGKVGRPTFLSLKNHLEDGLAAGYSTTLETARAANLLAFALFRLDERQKALDQTDWVFDLDGQRDNVVALANKAHILSHLGEQEEAWEAVQELKDLAAQDGFARLHLLARGELAASYMRFGPRFQQHASDTFREILPHAEGQEKWLWTLGLAVTYRHALNLQSLPYARLTPGAVSADVVVKLLQEIISSQPAAGTEAASPSLKAQAHVEMALVLKSLWDKKDQVRLGHQAHTGPMAACKQALKLDISDSSVLWKAGKIHRHCKDLFHSKKLLEESIQRQRTSAAYHHLGLTYKAMATNARYGKLKTRRGGKRQKERKINRLEKMRREQLEEGASAPLEHDRNLDSGSPRHGEKGPVDHRILGVRHSARYGEKGPVDRMRKAVKSAVDATEFDPEDKNIVQAFRYLELAVEFSHEENSRAMYDLALLHKSTRQLSQALACCQKIVQRGNGDEFCPSGLLDQVSAREQMGLIFQQQAQMETDPRKKERLARKATDSLLKALEKAAEFFEFVHEVKDNFVAILHSPTALLQEADTLAKDETSRRKQKANIFSLLSDHKKSLTLLEEIAEEERDAEYYRDKLRYLQKAGKFQAAVTCLALLKKTALYSDVMKLSPPLDASPPWADIYIQAGRQALLDGTYSGGCFDKVFRERLPAPDARFVPPPPKRFCSDDDSCPLPGAQASGGTGTEKRGAQVSGLAERETQALELPKTGEREIQALELPNAGERGTQALELPNTGERGTQSLELPNAEEKSAQAFERASAGKKEAQAPDVADPEQKDGDIFDVMLLHDFEDDFIEDKAKQLAQVLRRVLGLRVVRGDENYLVGSHELTNIHDNMDSSRLVVVLPGRQPMTSMFRYSFLSHLAERDRRTVAVLEMEGVVMEADLCRTLSRPRCLQCEPQLLLLPGQAAPSEAALTSACRLFVFLADLGGLSTLQPSLRE